MTCALHRFAHWCETSPALAYTGIATVWFVTLALMMLRMGV